MEAPLALRAGFIGRENIGKPMARRRVAAGLETVVRGALPAPAETPGNGVALPGTGLVSRLLATGYGVEDGAGG